MYQAFHPGKEWLDTEGKPIHAHGGSVMYWDGLYYWYGENKEKTNGTDKIWHWGVRCYTSSDLYNWEDKGLIIPPEPDDPTSPLHPHTMMDRPTSFTISRPASLSAGSRSRSAAESRQPQS